MHLGFMRVARSSVASFCQRTKLTVRKLQCLPISPTGLSHLDQTPHTALTYCNLQSRSRSFLPCMFGMPEIYVLNTRFTTTLDASKTATICTLSVVRMA